MKAIEQKTLVKTIFHLLDVDYEDPCAERFNKCCLKVILPCNHSNDEDLCFNSVSQTAITTAPDEVVSCITDEMCLYIDFFDDEAPSLLGVCYYEDDENEDDA